MKDEDYKVIAEQLGVPKIPVLDLSHYIAIKKERAHSGMRIGVLKDNIDGLTSFKAGEIVLFTPYTVEESYGNMLWKDMERHVKLCTMEVPSSRYFSGESRISTVKTTVGVPMKFIAYEIVTEPETDLL